MAPEEATCWVADVAAIDDLLSAGVNRQTIRRRLSGQRWQQPTPRVVCRTTGTLTAHQWMLVALAHGGPGAMISHGTAGTFWGFGATSGPTILPVHVTVPHGRRRPSTSAVQVHQSVRPCEPRLVEDVLVTPPARTAVDMALCLTSATSVAALADLALGSRSAAEARLLHLMRRADIPLPELNAPVSTSLGTRYVDALWRSLGKGVEVDGQAFHLDAAAWQADLVRQNAIQSEGIVLLRIAARRLWTEPDAVIAEIRAFLGLPRP